MEEKALEFEISLKTDPHRSGFHSLCFLFLFHLPSDCENRWILEKKKGDEISDPLGTDSDSHHFNQFEG
jgi:hypothetical protein